jgi:hypothetical protein
MSSWALDAIYPPMLRQYELLISVMARVDYFLAISKHHAIVGAGYKSIPTY